MKKLSLIFFSLLLLIVCCGFTTQTENDILQKDSVNTIKKTIKIGFYGQPSHILERIAFDLQNWNNDFAIESVDYGTDESGQVKLLSDLRSKNPPDLVITNGYTMPSCDLFTDLYSFIDSDNTISRDDFFPFLLKKLEKNDKLYQIWGSIGLDTAFAFFP